MFELRNVYFLEVAAAGGSHLVSGQAHHSSGNHAMLPCYIKIGYH